MKETSLTFFFFLILLMSCKHADNAGQNLKTISIDFSYNDTFGKCFSIKADSISDTMWLKYYFLSAFKDSFKINQTYFGILQPDVLYVPNDLINNINALDSSYDEGYNDGIAYQFYLKNLNKFIYIHSDSAPKSIGILKDYLIEQMKQVSWHEKDTNISFTSAVNIAPPPASQVKTFTAPRVE